LALAPLAIFAGLIPLTLAGIGTRDTAVIFLYRAYLLPSAGAALGILYTARYLLPALAGLPFLGQYMVYTKKAKESLEKKHESKG
jgi:uncharacterized membrane protein YbhN (UPF0104 family)